MSNDIPIPVTPVCDRRGCAHDASTHVMGYAKGCNVPSCSCNGWIAPVEPVVILQDINLNEIAKVRTALGQLCKRCGKVASTHPAEPDYECPNCCMASCAPMTPDDHEKGCTWANDGGFKATEADKRAALGPQYQPPTEPNYRCGECRRTSPLPMEPDDHESTCGSRFMIQEPIRVTPEQARAFRVQAGFRDSFGPAVTEVGKRIEADTARDAMPSYHNCGDMTAERCWCSMCTDLSPCGRCAAVEPRIQREPITCGSCKFQQDGACKRYPPTRVYNGAGLDVAIWPVVRPEKDWCGDHES